MNVWIVVDSEMYEIVIEVGTRRHVDFFQQSSCIDLGVINVIPYGKLFV